MSLVDKVKDALRGGAELAVRTGKAIDAATQKVEPAIDTWAARIAISTGMAGGAYHILGEYEMGEGTGFGISLAAGALTYGVNSWLNAEKSGEQRIAAWSEKVNKSRVSTWAQRGALSALLLAGGGSLKQPAEDVFIDVGRASEAITEQFVDEREYYPLPPKQDVVRVQREGDPAIWRVPPEGFHDLSHKEYFSHDFRGTELLPKQPHGKDRSARELRGAAARVQRSLRWKPIAEAAAAKYSLPNDELESDLLLAMVMQESYGDPLQPNSGHDGGIGLTHQQGTTASAYGAKIFGSSNRDSDRAHGRELKRMIERCDDSLPCVAEYDERAHPVKNLDVAARIVREGRERYGSWIRGARYFRGGSDEARDKYERDVRKWMNALNDEEVLEYAQDAFNKANSYSYNDYLQLNWEMAENFELQKYNTLRSEDQQ